MLLISIPVQTRQASSIGVTSFSWKGDILPTMSQHGYDLLEHQSHNNSEQHKIQGALKMLGSVHLYKMIFLILTSHLLEGKNQFFTFSH